MNETPEQIAFKCLIGFGGLPPARYEILNSGITAAIRDARLAGARAALGWAHSELYRWDFFMAARHILTADPAAVLAAAEKE